MSDEDRMMRVAEVAKYLGFCPKWVYAAAKAKRITHYRIGNRIVFRPEDVAAFREQLRVAGRAA